MPLNDQQVADLDAAITRYSFPAVYFDFVANTQVGAHMLAVEAAIQAMLVSPIAQHVRDGLANVIYWGYAQAIDEQLSRTPNKQTRNRKPLEELPGPFGSTWELRFGPDNQFRVFYEVVEAERTVWVFAIGIKDGNRLLIAGEEFQS